MPRKKSTEQTSAPNKNVPEKPPRKRAKKEKVEKPKLNTPTVIKIKIPKKKKSLNVMSPIIEPEPKMRRLSPSDALKRKIDLANEVALAQLVKKPATNESPRALPVEEPKKPKRVLRRPKVPAAPKGKAKKSKDVPEIVIDCTTEANAEPVLIQKPVKRVNKKLAMPKADVKPKVTNKQMKKADSTSKQSRKQTKDISNTEAKLQNTEKKKRGIRGKTMEDVTSTDIPSSPSVLDNNQKTIQNDIKSTNIEIANSVPKSPLRIDSRKTSTSECHSWTKDISSSSTTTCVSVDSNDFYRIDKKIPVLRLSQVDNKWRKQHREKDDYSSSSDSENSDQVTKYSSYSNSSQSVDLSSESSYTDQNNFQRNISKDGICKYALEKLSSQVKKLDLEFVNWIGHDSETVDEEIKMIQDKMFKILKEENEAITYCLNIKKIFKPDDNNSLRAKNDCESQNEFLERANKELNNTINRSEDDEFTSTRSRYVMFDQNCDPEEDPLHEPKVTNDSSEGDDKFTDKVQCSEVRYMSFEGTPYNDDDDALSLFAESLTGLEFSRLNSAASMTVTASEQEEYIPQPLSKDCVNFERHTYYPTKILSPERVQNFQIEKQNADSTYRETDYDAQYPEVGNENLKLPICSTNCITPSTNEQTKLPSIFDTTYRIPQSHRSVVFKGVCFYNLISKCMKTRCLYPHKQISEIEVKNTLNRLSDYAFVKEYMIMRNWPVLRRKFGLLYVDEGQARSLTATLLEMTIDFISKAKSDSVEDLKLKVDVSERTLLHLNTVDINKYHILKHNFGQDILLCDVFMHTIAETQNFSRFKLVFIKLTNYIIENGRTFLEDVASHILERVCILPPEKSLASAVVKLIQNTDASIFKNSMIQQFENQLLSLDKESYDELLAYKNQSVKIPYTSPHLSQEGDRISVPYSDRENRYTSPDTTKLDMIKAIKDPIIKRTINLPQVAFTPHCHTNQRSIKPDWRNNNYRRHRQILRPPMPIRFSGPQRHVAFGPPPNSSRTSGPYFNSI